MRYYPIHLDLSQKKVLVLGGGRVAFQKIEGLLQAGARVCVISPRFCPEVETFIQEGSIEAQKRAYQPGDLKGYFIAFGATNHPETNRIIHQEAQERGILFNAVDQPEECDFIVPARVKKGDLLITVSTSGKAPGFSKALRRSLEQLLGPAFEEFVEGMGKIRERLFQEGRREALPRFFNEKGEILIKALLGGDLKEVNRILQGSFGEDFFI